MRILLDESLPRDLGVLLTGHDVATVPGCGWSGMKNGQLLALAARQFEAFLTADRNIEFQQNLSTLPLSVLVLVVRNTRLETIEPLVPDLLRALNHLPPRTLRKIGPVM